MFIMEILIGLICSLLRIALGYATVLVLFSGIQLFQRARMKSKK